MKTCKKCKGTRFRKVKRINAKGESYITSRCADCQNKYTNKKKFWYKWYLKNTDKWNTYLREYYGKENRYRVKNSLNAKRIRERTFGDKKAITEFYRNTPEGYEVDHIVPLNGKNISGLHTRSNLQYLTIHDNRVKSNKV